MKKFSANSDLTLKEYEYLEDNVLNVPDPYQAYLSYLKDKHGSCTNNYFANKNCASKLPSFNGIHRHHDMENKVACLSRPDVAKANPWTYQEAKNLTYCKPAEHILLHILIAEQGELGIYGAMKLLTEHNVEPKLKQILIDRLNNSATVFTWNQTVVIDAVQLLDTYKLCYMNVATGVGKSTSAVEVAKAVNRDFIVISPANKINDSWEKHNKSNPHFKGTYTYTKFCRLYNTLNLTNTLIIADEAHHLLEKGNGKWGEAVIAAFEQNNNSMLLGLSASKFRAKNRRKADSTMEEVWHRIFQGHVAQGIKDLPEGIEKGVLAPITYVCACYNKEALNDLITLSSSWSNTSRKVALKGKLDLLKNETNIATLLNNYQPEKMVRDLVFIEHIGETEIVNSVTGLVEKINDYEQAKAAIKAARPELTDDNFRLVHSKQTEDENKTAFDWFETEADDARYLVSVGMVKEGYHPEVLTGLIIFRRIGAATVFEQILGRAAVLKSKAKHNIVVFDFVDAVRSSKFKFEAGNGTGNGRAVRPDVVQKLSTLTSCGVQVIDYVEKLDELKRAMESENCAPVFTAEELL